MITRDLDFFMMEDRMPPPTVKAYEVKATTASGRGRKARRKEQDARKLAKSAARRHFACLPKRVEKTRMMFTPRHCSRAG